MKVQKNRLVDGTFLKHQLDFIREARHDQHDYTAKHFLSK